MSKKGSITTTDYIDFDKATAVGRKLLKDKKKHNIGLYILVSINTGLRASDILKLQWKDLDGSTLIVKEQKTNKIRKIAINESIQKLTITNQEKKGFIFISRKESVYSIQQINRLLKQVFKNEAKTKNISTHSLRKCFGRRVWDNYNQSERALVYLMELFNHSSLATTKKYLGIRQEELDDIYRSL